MSIYSRYIARPRPMWIILVVSMLLLLSPVGAVSLDGNLNSLFTQGQWRPVFLSPIVIIYILIVSQLMAKTDTRMLEGFRPVLKINDEIFNRLVIDSSRIHPILEIGALLVGVVIGIPMGLSWTIETSWLRIYIIASLSSMYGLLFWTIICLIAGTKLISMLHQQPMDVNILDIRPFEPVGRHSLISALVFVGGVVLAMLFGLDLNNIMLWQTWAFILPLLAVPVLIFFLNMRHTHRILLNEKKRQLTLLAHEIHKASHRIQAYLAQGGNLEDASSGYASLVMYEARIRTASTWPYNIGMIRTLFISILLPLFIKGISFILFGE